MKNSELWLQMAPASAVCGELGLPSPERVYPGPILTLCLGSKNLVRFFDHESVFCVAV